MTGKEVFELRRSCNLSQRDFAQLINRTRSYVSKIERGFHHVTSAMEFEINSKIEQFKNGICDNLNQTALISTKNSTSKCEHSRVPVKCPECGRKVLPLVVQPEVPEVIAIERKVSSNNEMLGKVLETLGAISLHDEMVQRKVREIVEERMTHVLNVCGAYAKIITKTIATTINLLKTRNTNREDIIILLETISDQMKEMVDMIPTR